jgi:hypothetical protein
VRPGRSVCTTSPRLPIWKWSTWAIAYNTGGFNPARGLKQGFQTRGWQVLWRAGF